MSVYDTFANSQDKSQNEPTTPKEVSTGKVLPAAEKAQKPDNQQAVTQSVYDQFKEKAPKASVEPKSVYDAFLETKKAPVESPYFYAKTDKGGAIGKSDELDSSGKPFLGYRNPGDTATTTDKTRIATTFDPRTPQKVSADTFHTPRVVEGRAALKQAMGGTYSDQLDHKISLELAGSNDQENLGIEPLAPGSKNTATDSFENSLAKDVADGKISLFDAQAKLAKAKGIKAPWGTDKKGWMEKTWESIKHFFVPEAQAATTEGSVYDRFQAEQKKPVTDFKSPDDFKRESSRLEVASNEIQTESERLSKEKESLDTTDEAAVNRFNAAVSAYNGKLTSFKADVEKYDKAIPTKKDMFDAYEKAGGTTIGPTKLGTAEYDSDLIRQKNEEGKINIKVPFQDKTISFDPPWSTTVGSGNETFKAPIANFLLNFPTAVLEAIPRAIVTVKEEAQTFGTESTIHLGPVESAMYGGTPEYKNINQEIKDRLARGDGVLASYLGAISGKALDVAFGAQVGASAFRSLSKILASKGDYSVIEASKTLGSPKTMAELDANYKQLAKQLHPDLMGGDDTAMKAVNKAKQLLEEKGLATVTKLTAANAARYTEWVGRETNLGDPILPADLKVKDRVQGKLLPLKQLPGYREIAPSPVKAGLSAQPIEPVGFGPEKPKAETDTYKPEGDLTVKTLDRLSGKTSVSKQFISDLTNNPDLKQPERDVIRSVLAEYPEGKDVPVKDFAEKVQSELLPLNRYKQVGKNTGKEHYPSRYENIALDEESRGEVANYREHVYESPIETSAGNVHAFSTDNYFAHTRIEDMAPEGELEDIVNKKTGEFDTGDTRRVIEVQSDLFQKGRLENEADPVNFIKKNQSEVTKYLSAEDAKRYRDLLAERETSINSGMRKGRNRNEIEAEISALNKVASVEVKKEKGFDKLEPYRNTWHERIIREEVKQAAKDGKSTLLFPTGETAMKIEGLDNSTTDTWSLSEDIFERPQLSDLKVGTSLFDRGEFRWIITSVLGEGKFEAVPEDIWDKRMVPVDPTNPNGSKEVFQKYIDQHSEQFDISTELDKENPIYRFYEKEIGRYLKNRYQATLHKDPRDVTWWKVDVNPEEATKPVQAFKKGKVTATRLERSAKKQGVPFNITVEKAQEIARRFFNDKEISFIFPNKVLPGTVSAWGRFTEGSISKNPLIEVVQNNGKVSDKTLYHESFHAYFRQFMSPSERTVLLKAIKKNVATLPDRINYWTKGYDGNDVRAEEYAADAFADYMKEKTSPPGIKSIFQKILDKVRAWIRRATGLKDVFERMEKGDRSFVSKNYKTLKVDSFDAAYKRREADPEAREENIEKLGKAVAQNYTELKEVPKGDMIENPKKLVAVAIPIKYDAGKEMGLKSNIVSFTRLSLKHIIEKGEQGIIMLNRLPDILKNPTEIRQGNTEDRFLIVRREEVDDVTPDVLVLQKKDNNILVTGFHSDDKYLEGFDLLWRAAVPPSQQPLREGGSSLSALRGDQNSQGIPARNRTEMASLEEKQPSPLAYGDKGAVPEAGIEPATPAVSGQRSTDELPRQDKKSVSEPSEPVNGDKSEKAVQDIAPEARDRIEKAVNEEHLNSILEMIAGSKDAEHIASILFSDFGIPMRESQTLGERLKHIHSTVNVKKVIEGDELLRKRILNEPIMQKIPEPLYYRLLSNELEGEALNNAPGRGLAKYAARSGVYRGSLPEMPSNKASINMTELGFQNWEEARKAYDKYAASKMRFEEEKVRLKRDLRKFIESQRLGDMTAEWKEYMRKEKLTHAEENELVRRLSTAGNLKDKMRILKQSKQGRARLSRARLRLIDRLTYQEIPELEQETLGSQSSRLLTLQNKYSKEFETLPKIISSEPTPVKRKVGMIDYLRTPDRVLKKIGLGQAADMIRHGYESYVAELPGHIELLSDWDRRIHEGKTTKEYDASKTRIFHFLDGTLDNAKNPMSTSERRIAGEMRLYLRDWADRLDLPDDKRLSHYITHIFEQSLMAKEFDEELAKIIQDKVPGSVYDPFLQARIGARGFIEDPIRALEAYAKRAVRKANMDPALEYLKAASGRLELSQLNYVKRFADRVNLRPTEWDNLLDNTIKQTFGYRFGARPTAAITRSARKAVYRAMLGLNFGSAIKNLTQGVNTYALLGEKYTAIGYIKLMTNMGAEELHTSGIFGMDIIQDKTISAYKKNVQNLDKGLFAMFNTVEYINRAATYWGAKAKALDEGKHEAAAIEYAKKVVRDTQFTYGSIDTPAALQSDLVKTFTQFTTFGVKETEFLIEMLKAKNWAGLLRYIAAAFLIVNLLGKYFNISYKDFLPLSFLTRFGSAPVLALPLEVLKAVLNAPDAYGNKPTAAQRALTIGGTALAYLPASAQAKKTYQGVQKVFNPAKPTGEVAKTPGNVSKALLLGPSNIDTVKDTFKDSTSRLQGLLGQKPGSLAAKAESEFKRLKALSPDEASAQWEKLNQSDPSLAKRVADIAKEDKLGLTPEERLIKQLNVSMGVRANYIANKLKSLPDDKARAAMWSDYETKGIITKNVAPQLLKILQK